MPIYGPHLSAGMSTQGNTSGTTGLAHDRMIVVGGNNITLSQSILANSGTLTISAANQTTQAQSWTATGNTVGTLNTTATGNAMYFSGGPNISVGMTGNTVYLSGGAGAAGDGVNILAAGSQTANTTGTVRFADSNGITFGMSNSSIITASHNGLTTAAASNHSHGNPTLALTNLTGTTASASNGLTISLSANPAGGADGVNIISAGTQVANTTGSVRFADSNGITFGMSNNSVVTASHNGITSQSTQFLAITLGGNTAGTTTFHATNNASIHLHGGNNITLSGNGSSITVVGAAGGAAGSNTLGMSNLGNTSGTSGVISGSALALYFAGGNNVTLSQSINGSSATITVIGPSPGGGAGVTAKMLGTPIITSAALSNATFSIQPIFIDAYMTATNAAFWAVVTGNTNSSGAISLSLGLYTINGSTMSLASSTSQLIQWTSGTNSTATTGTQYGIFSGGRYRNFSLNSWQLTPGNYMLAVWGRSTNNGTLNIGFNMNTNNTMVSMMFTSQSGNSHVPMYSSVSFTTAMPSAITLSEPNMIRSGAAARQPAMTFWHSSP